MVKMKEVVYRWLSRRRARKTLIAKKRNLEESLKKRTYECFVEKWNFSGNKFDAEFLFKVMKEVAKIMELPNGFIYPEDKLLIVTISFRADMRDVEAIMLLEERLNIEFLPEKLDGEITMKDLIVMD